MFGRKDRRPFDQLVDELLGAPSEWRRLAPLIAEAGDRAGVDRRRRYEIVLAEWEAALQEPTLSVDEENRLASIAAGLGAPRDVLADRLDLMERAIVARANDGRFPTRVESPKVSVWRSGETVHLETVAEVRRHVRTAASPGWAVRVPIGMGLLYTAHLVGREEPAPRTVVVDRGAVSVTDQRIFYCGANRAFETTYAELVELRREPRSLVLLSTRYSQSLNLTVAVPDAIAALINLQANIERARRRVTSSV